MSEFIVIPSAVLEDSRLTLREIRVLMALYAHRNPRSTNVVFPSRERIAAMTGFSITRVSAITKRLAAAGWLVKDGSGGRSRATRYTLAETVPELGTVPKSETVPDLDENGTRIGLLNGTQIGYGHRIDQLIDQEYTNTSPPTPASIPASKPPTERTGALPAAPTDFDAFWNAYPRKVGKLAALKAWKAGKSRPPIEAVLAAIRVQAASEQWKRDGGQYIPYPATWLNQGRWADEVGGVPAQAGGYKIRLGE